MARLLSSGMTKGWITHWMTLEQPCSLNDSPIPVPSYHFLTYSSMASSSKGLSHALLCASKNIATGAHSPADQNRLSSQLWMQSFKSQEKALNSFLIKAWKEPYLQKRKSDSHFPRASLLALGAWYQGFWRTNADQQIKRLVSNTKTRQITEACPRYETLLSLHDIPAFVGVEQKRELSAPKI